MEDQTYQQRIRDKLNAYFTPIYMELKDDSKKHLGHAGHNPKGETHFSLQIVSARFLNLSSLARHRLIYEVLDLEIKEHVHALSIKAMTPIEYKE